jgi:rare lipoprotein A (peptidoglycan hydrolase)
MRHRLFVVLESALLGMGLLALTPSANPTTTGQPRNSASVQSSTSATPPIIPSTTNTVGPRKPLRVWDCAASWYGEDFDGRPTATGEIYDMYATTAAHPTLPLGSIVRVVNTRNRRSQVVRINDRGPYVEGRGLDVSYEVARRLDFDQTGVAEVRVELLEVPPGSDGRTRPLDGKTSPGTSPHALRACSLYATPSVGFFGSPEQEGPLRSPVPYQCGNSSGDCSRFQTSGC